MTEPAKLSTLTNIDKDTKWTTDVLGPIPTYEEGKKVLNSTILKDFTLTCSWIDASLIKTGFNTRKTTKKGVRRMSKSLRSSGYMQSNAVVIYPGATAEVDDESDVFHLTESDVKSGIKFMCADGMHRVRSVYELSELKRKGAKDIVCGNKVRSHVFACHFISTLTIALSMYRCTQSFSAQTLQDGS